MTQGKTKFSIGQAIVHKLFDYRGVIVGVDAAFQGEDSWYERMARSRPPKDKPWYHVLVHNSTSTTYVAERNLQADASGEPINHPLVKVCLGDRFENGKYFHSMN